MFKFCKVYMLYDDMSSLLGDVGNGKQLDSEAQIFERQED
jgi:hypothetical protein